MLRSLILDFVADFTSVELDRLSCSRLDDTTHRGSKEDVWYSLDEQWREMLSEETRVDVGYTVLSHLKQAKVGEKDNRKSTDLPRLIPQSQQIPSGQRLIEEIKGKSKDAQPKSTPPSLAPKSTPPSLAPKSTPPPLAPKSTPPSLGSKGKLEHSVFVTNSTGHSQKVKVKVKLLEIRSAAEIDLVVFEVCEGLGLGTRYMRG